MSYHAPINAIQYLLKYAVGISQLTDFECYETLEDDLVSDILNGAWDFADQVLAPINRAGDQFGAVLEEGCVKTAPGFKEAYQAFVDGGWQSLSVPEGLGGMGLPQVLSVGVNEMLYGANMAFGLAPMLTASAMNAIIAHASDDLKAVYLPKMISGEWSGGMNLTEPQAGSDLGALRTNAVPNGDGSYGISGQKIFITWGDHDCADNIVHLVLARLPGAPAGSRGISLFLVPKYLPDENGNPGKRNGLKPIGLEHKLGIHGSPTCVMEFDGASGWLVGPENRGLACMFTMMNEARLFVGVQGVAIGERSYQQALAYAKDRVQGRVIDAKPDTPILGHPDVKRMIMDMKAGLMGARAINMATAIAGDMAYANTDKLAQASSHARDALLTPIAKAYGSDMGVMATSLAVQIHGGMGFIEETGAAQHYRDARIAPIYEGTNGIQAIDLVGRKLRRDGGEAMFALIADLRDICAQVGGYSDGEGTDLSASAAQLEAGISNLAQCTKQVLKMSEKDALAVATPYLELCGDVISSALLWRSVIAGYKDGAQAAPSMHRLAQYHMNRFLSRAEGTAKRVEQGGEMLFANDNAGLADI